MSRSIHTTKRALRRERAHPEESGHSLSSAMTELEAKDLTKTARKLSGHFKRQAEAAGASVYADIAVKPAGIRRTLRGKGRSGT